MPDTSGATSPMFDQRPWGTFTVLDEGANYKVKRIEVFAGKRLSYQKHSQRAEHWVVVQGTARVTLNDELIVISKGELVATLRRRRVRARRSENSSRRL